jgi:hypothetical protein
MNRKNLGVFLLGVSLFPFVLPAQDATVRYITRFKPVWTDVLPDDENPYEDFLVISPAFKEIEVTRIDSLTKTVHHKKIDFDNPENFDPEDESNREFKNFIKGIRVSHRMANQDWTMDSETLTVDKVFSREFEIEFTAAAAYHPLLYADEAFELDTETFQRLYLIRALPEYDFSVSSYDLSSDSWNCFFDEMSFIPCSDESGLSHFIFINSDISEFINKNYENLLVDQSNFDHPVLSLVTFSPPPGERFLDCLNDNNRKQKMFNYLKQVRQHGKFVAAIGTAMGTTPFPILSEPIAPEYADWFLRVDFNDSYLPPDSRRAGAVSIKNLALKKESGLEDYRNRLTQYILDPRRNIPVEHSLDVAKILIFLGKLAEAESFINKYAQYLENPPVNRLNHDNNKYYLALFWNFASYWHDFLSGSKVKDGIKMPPRNLINNPGDSGLLLMEEAVNSAVFYATEEVLPGNSIFRIRKNEKEERNGRNIFEVDAKKYCRSLVDRSGISNRDKLMLFKIFGINYQ